jgi:peptidoglycan/LPS O-acetylase OafA/YrhL
MPTRTRIPQIQALRALAALLVLIYHADWIPGGYIGVDIFYVISGYLITGLLVRELNNTGTVALASFYAGRFRRLLPSSFVVILSTGVAGWLLFPPSMRESLGRDLIAASTYLSNFLFALWNNDYQNLNTTPSPFIHFWSLAVEEQFYLFWPITLLALYKIGKSRAIIIGISVIGTSSFILSLYLTDASPIWSFYILPTRAWELAAGSLLVFLPFSKFEKPHLALIGVAGLIFAAVRYNDQTAFPGTAAIVPVLATSLLLLASGNWPPLLDIIGNSKVVQWLGQISYPLYLWHWPVLVIPSIYWARPLSLTEKLFYLCLTVLLADFTSRLIEQPLRYVNWKISRTFKVACTTTTALVIMGTAIFFSYSNTIMIGENGKYSLDEIIAKSVNFEDGCNLKLGQTIAPVCEYGDLSAVQTIVLYGDSHAAHWLPALEVIGRNNKIKIVSLTKSACPAAEVIKEIDGQYSIDDCQGFRDASIARIATIKPLAVISTGLQPPYAPYSTRDGVEWWLEGEAILFDRLKSLTDFAIYLTDTPFRTISVPDCLAAGRGAICDEATEVSAKVAKGFIAINPTPWLCSRSCPAVIDGIVTYRDHSHLTNAMSEHLATNLLAELKKVGVL